MALLKCKMCGGTLDYDRSRNLAVCPYCGSKSTVFEQDRKLFEQFQEAFAAILNQDDTGSRKAAEEGFWVESSMEKLVREDGETIKVAYLTRRRTDMCTMYVARRNVVFVFEREKEDSARRYCEMAGQVAYPDPGMEKELSNYIPHIVTKCMLADGRAFLAIEKAEGVYPLGMLGILMDRHVAWIISRLENLCCLLEYNRMVLNGLTVENLFVDPANHQVYLYGGWWFAGYQGAEAPGASGILLPYLKRGASGKSRNDIFTDLSGIRLAAVKLLGGESREGLRGRLPLPEPFCRFLENAPKDSAAADFTEWDRVLGASYGERRFIPLSMTEEEVYSKSVE